MSEDGEVVYQLKHPIRGRTHRVMDPHQFLARLCALIPPPRHPLIRFHGVFGPASKWRPDVVPDRPAIEPCHGGGGESEEQDIRSATLSEAKWQSQRLDWAALLHRVYDIDALRCECGGEIRFEELIESPKDAKAFLTLHEVESPRLIDAKKHVRPWSDAPNVALAFGDIGAGTEPDPVAQPSHSIGSVSEGAGEDLASVQDDSHLHEDEIPQDDHHFVDEIPPD